MTRGVFRWLTPARQQRQPERRGHMHPPASPRAGRDGDNADVKPLPLGPGEGLSLWIGR